MLRFTAGRRLLPSLLAVCLVLVFWSPCVRARDGQINLYSDGSTTMVVSAPGSYVLVADVAFLDEMTGIRVEASGVTIDLNGHRLQGFSSGTAFGVQVTSGNTDVTIRNGSIQGFGYGIRGLGRTVVEDVRISDCGFFGISLGGPDGRVSRVVVRDCGTAGEGAPDPLGDLTGVVFRGGITAGLRTQVLDSTVSSLNVTSTADLLGISVGSSSRVSGCVVSALASSGGWISGIRAGSGVLVEDVVVRDIESSGKAAEGVAVGERSTVRGAVVTAVAGLPSRGIVARDVSVTFQLEVADGLTVEGSTIEDLRLGAGSGVPAINAVRGGNRLRVLDSRIGAISDTGSEVLAIEGLDDSFVDSVSIATLGASHGCAVTLGANASVTDTTVSGFTAFGSGELRGILVGDNSALHDCRVQGLMSGTGAAITAIEAGEASGIEDSVAQGLESANTLYAIVVGERGTVRGCEVRDLTSGDFATTGIQGYANSVIESNIVQDIKAGSGNAGYASGIRVSAESMVRGNTVNGLSGNRLRGIFCYAPDGLPDASRRETTIQDNTVSRLLKTGGDDAFSNEPLLDYFLSAGIHVEQVPATIVGNTVDNLDHLPAAATAQLAGIRCFSPRFNQTKDLRLVVSGNTVNSVRGTYGHMYTFGAGPNPGDEPYDLYFGTAGIDVRGRWKGLLVSDNRVNGIEGDFGSCLVMWTELPATVVGNEFAFAKRGLSIIGIVGIWNNALVRDNLFTCVDLGILIDTNRNVITGNKFYVPRPSIGDPWDIRFDTAYGSGIDNMNVVDNNIVHTYEQ